MARTIIVNGEIYHIYSKSIGEIKIFRNKAEFERMKNLIRYYRIIGTPQKFSVFCRTKNREDLYKNYFAKKECFVETISYCLMPTHIHLILKQLTDNGISTFMSNILNSYTRYFNVKTKRKGPLWESRFKRVAVGTDEQLLHLTRYIHLNPVTAYLTESPGQWEFSSYGEFMGKTRQKDRICNFESVIMDIEPYLYKEFVTSQIGYQRELAAARKQP
jgi:putative transposase